MLCILAPAFQGTNAEDLNDNRIWSVKLYEISTTSVSSITMLQSRSQDAQHFSPTGLI